MLDLFSTRSLHQPGRFPSRFESKFKVSVTRGPWQEDSNTCLDSAGSHLWFVTALGPFSFMATPNKNRSVLNLSPMKKGLGVPKEIADFSGIFKF